MGKVLREHAGGPRSHRAMTKAASGEAGPNVSAGVDNKVYLKDLTLEDRERVLRLLFAKINIAHKATKPVTTDFNDDEFDNNQRPESEESSGAFFVTRMEDGDTRAEDSGIDDGFGSQLPALVPNSRGSN